MKSVYEFRPTLSVIVGVMALIVYGCYPVATNVKSPEELSQTMERESGVIVTGRMRWMQNGEELEISRNMFGNTVTFQLYDLEDKERIFANVEKDGLISWILEPGEYHVARVSLMHRTNSYLGPAYFHLSVPQGTRAVYIGTLTMTTTRKSGFMGYKISLDGYSLLDNCEADCPEIQAMLGISAEDMRVGLLKYDNALAERWAQLD